MLYLHFPIRKNITEIPYSMTLGEKLTIDLFVKIFPTICGTRVQKISFDISTFHNTLAITELC